MEIRGQALRRIIILLKQIKTHLIILIPYSAGSKFLEWYCSLKFVQSFFFKHRTDLIRRFASSFDGHLNMTAVIRHSFTSNILRKWRFFSLAYCSPRQFDHWVAGPGGSNIQEWLRNGKGVVFINSHNAMGHCFLLYLVRLGFGNICHLGDFPHPLSFYPDWKKAIRQVEFSHSEGFYLRHLYTATQVLKQGGILHISPDGFIGNRYITLPFLGRNVPFRTGFAELVLDSGATVVPVFTSIDVSGYVKIEITNPLNSEQPGLSRADRIESLTRQYAGFLEKKWAAEPGNIAWPHMERLLEFPPLGSQ